MMWWKWHQNWCWNTETGALFGQTVKKNFTHTQNQWGCSHRHVYKRRSCTDISIIDFAVCRMIPQYNTIPPRRLHRVYVRVKWFLTICQKRTPISLFQHQFWCHFHQILLRYHTLWISSNKFIIFPHLWEMWLLKSVKFILKHSVHWEITSIFELGWRILDLLKLHKNWYCHDYHCYNQLL